jgi:hypothetical protein
MKQSFHGKTWFYLTTYAIMEETEHDRTELLSLLLPPRGTQINYRLPVPSVTELSCDANTLLSIIFPLRVPPANGQTNKQTIF